MIRKQKSAQVYTQICPPVVEHPGEVAAMGEIRLGGVPASGGKVFCGSYIGDNTSARKIALGITPRWVSVWTQTGIQGGFGAYEKTEGGFVSQEYPLVDKSGTVVISIVPGGFEVGYSSSYYTNKKDSVYLFLYGT